MGTKIWLAIRSTNVKKKISDRPFTQMSIVIFNQFFICLQKLVFIGFQVHLYKCPCFELSSEAVTIVYNIS